MNNHVIQAGKAASRPLVININHYKSTNNMNTELKLPVLKDLDVLS